ncbi:MAG: leucine--tRNA ligase [Candidatus Levybacteria bacterium]|nr:leucine--tRNA ligase [Candidatus Levybacteria bacterium]
MAAKNTSTTLSTRYQPQQIETKWQKKWEEKGIYQPDIEKAQKPFYNLMMFPYPSAEGLHVGNMYAFTGADVYGRFKRMQQHDVFEPIGLDGFGIHAENYALKIGKHPMDYSKVTEANFYRQLHAIGNGFDWSRTVETYKPNYYAWTQWLFVKLFKAGLAYKKSAQVNWCPSCKTVLADEQVINGECERCGSKVEKRQLRQWFFRITVYAERLLNNIPSLNWTQKVKIAQEQWIGKSEGTKIGFAIKGSHRKIEVFTTRPDTLFGATFIVLSPDNPLVSELSLPNRKEVLNYVSKALVKTEQERLVEGREKTGVSTGLTALHPVTKEEIPIWIADYVLMGYGTGGIMAVPAHDQRDFEFAKKYTLPIKLVIQPKDKEIVDLKQAYVGPGKLVNSNEWDAFHVPKDINKTIQWLEEKGIGEKKITYHIRDWLISRQRYWGPPIPMIYCEHCAAKGKSWWHSDEAKPMSNFKINSRYWEEWDSGGWYPAEELPVVLPHIKEYKPLGTGKSPLASDAEFERVTCPSCGKEAKRETDVSDTFLDSSWYFFRYPSTDIADEAFSKEPTKKWLPVHMYIGGAEHSVLHLLYARFITMFLHDQGLIDFDEPFSRFYAHGLLIKEGAKMSKSKGNVVLPDEYIAKFGADTVRTYLMFLGPYDQGGDFRDTGIEGMDRFLKRVWTLFTNESLLTEEKEDLQIVHKTVKEVTQDMEGLRYNVAIAKLMILYNDLAKRKKITLETVKIYLKLLAPFAPYMAEELWSRSAGQSEFNSVHLQPWPHYKPEYLKEDTLTIVVQVNGRVRDNLQVPADKASQEEIEKQAKASPNASKYLERVSIRKVIFVPGKLINFVV